MMLARLNAVLWTCVCVLTAARGNAARLRRAPDRGLSNSLEAVLLAVGAVIIAGLVVAAITAAVNGQIAKLP